MARRPRCAMPTSTRRVPCTAQRASRASAPAKMASQPSTPKRCVVLDACTLGSSNKIPCYKLAQQITTRVRLLIHSDPTNTAYPKWQCTHHEAPQTCSHKHPPLSMENAQQGRPQIHRHARVSAAFSSSALLTGTAYSPVALPPIAAALCDIRSARS